MSVYGYRCGRFPPVVKTAVPVDGRFEHIVLSCNATSDHAIIWIEREAERALEVSLSFYASMLSKDAPLPGSRIQDFSLIFSSQTS